MEHPLDGAIEQHGVIEIGNPAVEPEMDAGDRGSLETRQRGPEGLAFGSRREHAGEGVKGHGQDGVIEARLFAAHKQFHPGTVGAEALDGRAQLYFPAALPDVPGRAPVELGQGNQGNAHAPGLGRLQKRLAHHLGGIRDRNPVEILVQSAHQDGLPEAFDGRLGLVVAAKPGEKIFAGVGRGPRGQHRHGACD